jgi:uncharacterized protein
MKTTQRIDRIWNLRAFLDAWDHPDREQNRVEVDLRLTGFGNINSTGIPTNYTSPLLTRWHPLFAAALEEGVKPLVQLLVGAFGWISYTSCEGHRYAGESLPPAQRNVGLVARSEEEAGSMASILQAGCDEAHRRFPGGPVHVEVFRHGVAGEDLVVPAVDLIFHRLRSRGWDEYFQELDGLTAALVDALAASSPPAGGR